MESKKLREALQSIYHQECPEITEFHGDWGSVAVSRNLYNGLDFFENHQHICIIIGGPVLYFRDNYFLTGASRNEGTAAVYERMISGLMRWDEDISGPFVVLLIDKKELRVTCVTDLMDFIPVFFYSPGSSLMLATHVGTLAELSGQDKYPDQVSAADFILNNIVTFPYTVYENVLQLMPASVFSYALHNGTVLSTEKDTYWTPTEKKQHRTLRSAAAYLRNGIQGYIDRITENMDTLAQFITGGEDSRLIAGLLPPASKRDGYIFLDDMNREGLRARKAAEAYDLNFHPQIRKRSHYIDIFEEASDIIGCGFQYIHAHTLNFHSSLRFNSYAAFFGGYVSDILIKSHFGRKFYYVWRLSWFPDFFMKGESRTVPMKSDLFFPEILREIDARRRRHFDLVKSIRPKTAHEWFELWPISMHLGISNFYNNRRLFRSYEPFMSKESVKISAAAPPNWKLNRRLFHNAFQHYFRKSRWLLHADGRLPYFPWWVNIFIQTGVLQFRKVAGKLGYATGNQGPWGDWKAVQKSDQWNHLIRRFDHEYGIFQGAADLEFLQKGLEEGRFSTMERLNLLQCLYSLNKKSGAEGNPDFINLF